MNTKVLVLGSAGMAGSMIFKYLKNNKLIDAVGWDRKNFDVLKDDIPDISMFDYVINCIGLIKQKSSDKELLFKLNSDFPKALTKIHKKVIHISSDCVFSGKKGLYKYNDVKDAEDDYGMSKSAGEDIDALVLRTSIIGPSKDNSGLFEWLRNTKDDINGYTNHIWSGITTLMLAKTIESLIIRNLFSPIVVQIATEPISKLDLLQQINEVFSFGKNIIPTTQKMAVDRSMIADVYTLSIRPQLIELKEWIDNEKS